jgi:hypothetical protein
MKNKNRKHENANCALVQSFERNRVFVAISRQMLCRVCARQEFEKTEKGFYICKLCGAELEVISQTEAFFFFAQSFAQDYGKEVLEYEDKQNRGRTMTITSGVMKRNVHPEEILQKILQVQVEALISKFEVHPSLYIAVGELWKMYLLFIYKRLEENASADEKVSKSSKSMMENYLSSELTLAICFIACRRMRIAILLGDFAQMAEFESIPYLSCFTRFPESWSEYRPTLHPTASSLARLVQKITDSLSISVPELNFPLLYVTVSRELHLSRAPPIHTRTCTYSTHSTLTIADQLGESCARLHSIFSRDKMKLKNEALFCAAVFVIALKMAYGLTGPIRPTEFIEVPPFNEWTAAHYAAAVKDHVFTKRTYCYSNDEINRFAALCRATAPSGSDLRADVFTQIGIANQRIDERVPVLPVFELPTERCVLRCTFLTSVKC